MHWKHEHQLMLRPQTPETCSQEESTTHTLKAKINMDKRGGELRAHVERDETSLKKGESHGTTTGSAISLPCQVNEDVFTFCGSEGIKSCALGIVVTPVFFVLAKCDSCCALWQFGMFQRKDSNNVELGPPIQPKNLDPRNQKKGSKMDPLFSTE